MRKSGDRDRLEEAFAKAEELLGTGHPVVCVGWFNWPRMNGVGVDFAESLGQVALERADDLRPDYHPATGSESASRTVNGGPSGSVLMTSQVSTWL
jgi:hypothetical protein